VWLAIEPATGADGPLDPRIPISRVIPEELAALGYCAPTSGPDSPPERVRVTAWSIVPAGAKPIELRTITLPGVEPDASEGLFAPDMPGPEPDARWPSGRYVLVIRGETGRYERWFGVDVGRWTAGDDQASNQPDASITP